MSEIDWSKGPEAATHFWTGNDHFYIEVDGKFYLPGRIHDGPVNAPASWIAALVPRPSPVWSGEGLPPVSTVCEVDYCEQWQRCEIIAHFQQRCGMVAAFTVEFGDGAKSLDAFGAESFRPIRTPEQIAADERELRALDLFRIAWPETHRWSDLSPHWHEAFYRLADSAYRKQEVK